MGEILLELDRVCKYYTGNRSVVVGLNEIQLSFARGEFVAITGESGSGKSTLAQVLCGILPYESGEMRFRGKPTSHYDSGDWERYRRESISYISQNYGILPGGTVLSNVVSALRIQGMEPEQALNRGEELLKMVELWELRGRRAAKLSSGQKQRLAIARALAKPAPILVADEPTGNLDRENSEKVIELLSLAARDRLVILITHDFQEAEDRATRRIVLQDGRVTQNIPLREASPARVMPVSWTKKSRKPLSAYVAGLQMGGRPVWSLLVGAFFALTAFAVFAFLGTYLVNLDDTSTRIYDDSSFQNGDRTRLVLQRTDSGPFTREDYDALLTVDYVRALERNSYLADWQYAWQQDVDYTLHYHIKSAESTDSYEKEKVISVELLPDKCDFLQTVPLLPEGQTFLKAGRLPENQYEVVLAGPEERLGETMTIYYRDEKTMSVAAYVDLTVTVVGVTDFGSGLYFSDELSRIIACSVDNGGYLIAPVPGDVYDTRAAEEIVGLTPPTAENEILLGMANGRFLDVESIWVFRNGNTETPVELTVRGATPALKGIVIYTPEDGELPEFTLDRESMEKAGYELSEEDADALQTLLGRIQCRVRPGTETGTYLADYWITGDRTMAISQELYSRRRWEMMLGDTLFTALVFHKTPYAGYVLVNRTDFETLVPVENPNQVSLFLTDYAYADDAMEQIRDMGYLVVSPFRLGATRKNETLAQERMKTLQVCLLALAAVAVLQLLVLRELFGVENESYRLLADMGLGRKQAARSLLWQILCFTLAGQVLAYAGIRLCGVWGVRRIQTILRYLPWQNWLLLALVHLAVSLIAAALAVSAMQKRVYPQTRDSGDLNLTPLDEEEMEP